MAEKSDARLMIGAAVHANATFVTSLAECSPQFGSLAGSKLVHGTVQEVIRGTQNGQRTTRLRVEWQLPGGSKSKELALASVQVDPPPCAVPPSLPSCASPGTLVGG